MSNNTWLEKIDLAVDHIELDAIVESYLESIGENHIKGESYEDTSYRLNDNVMTNAAQKWHEINEAG